MPITLELRPQRQPCPDPMVIPTNTSTATRGLNYMVTITCVASFILCLRALIRAQRLRREAERVFLRKYQITFTHSERMNFLNGW